jgi:hypothetical protein
MADSVRILGLFKDDVLASKALGALAQTSCSIEEVYGPYPSPRIREQLKLKKSKVGYFTLAGGIMGLIAGFALAIFTATRWNIIVSGKPVVAWVPFMIVGFEFTILFAVIGNVIGFLTQARLPQSNLPSCYDERFSGEHFGILVNCESEIKENLIALIKSNQGESKLLVAEAK